MRLCMYCQRQVNGRSDKKYCCDACRYAARNKRKKQSNSRKIQVFDRLQKNERVLKNLFEIGIKSVSKIQLKKAGFDFRFYTSTLQNKSGCYIFIFEMGYREILSKEPIDQYDLKIIRRFAYINKIQ